MRKTLKTVAALAMLLGAIPALAQKDVRAPDQVKYAPITRIEIDVGGTVEGTPQGPGSTYAMIKRPTLFPSMMKVRMSFAPELQSSVDNL